MYTFKVYTQNESHQVWLCKANNEDGVWESLSEVKKLPVTELKKLFKIKKDVNRTSNNDRLINDQKSNL